VATAAGRRWLDALRVDPFEMRQKGIKGKKKLVEQLDAYYTLWQVAHGQERMAIEKRIREVVAATYEDRYHDMLTTSDLWFKQDATSYLRGALVMQRLGLDTARYREEIGKIQGRLNGHMAERGVFQQQVFHWYYREFGLQEPFALGSALGHGLIAHRADVASLSSDDAYDLTHEIFGAYEYGDRLDLNPFSEEDRRYLRGALDALVARYMASRDPDLVAELVACQRYLRFVDAPSYNEGLSFLLANQNSDGSWGHYDEQRKRLGDYVRQGFELHTTMVVLHALVVALHEPWNQACGAADLPSSSSEVP